MALKTRFPKLCIGFYETYINPTCYRVRHPHHEKLLSFLSHLPASMGSVLLNKNVALILPFDRKPNFESFSRWVASIRQNNSDFDKLFINSWNLDSRTNTYKEVFEDRATDPYGVIIAGLPVDISPKKVTHIVTSICEIEKANPPISVERIRNDQLKVTTTRVQIKFSNQTCADKLKQMGETSITIGQTKYTLSFQKLLLERKQTVVHALDEVKKASVLQVSDDQNLYKFDNHSIYVHKESLPHTPSSNFDTIKKFVDLACREKKRSDLRLSNQENRNFDRR